MLLIAYRRSLRPLFIYIYMYIYIVCTHTHLHSEIYRIRFCRHFTFLMHPGIRDLQKTALLHVNRCIWARRGMWGQARRPRRKRPWGCDRVVNAGSRLVYCSIQDELSQLLSTEFNIFEHKIITHGIMSQDWGPSDPWNPFCRTRNKLGYPHLSYLSSSAVWVRMTLQVKVSRHVLYKQKARAARPGGLLEPLCHQKHVVFYCVFFCLAVFHGTSRKLQIGGSGHFVRLHQSNSREHFFVFETILTFGTPYIHWSVSNPFVAHLSLNVWTVWLFPKHLQAKAGLPARGPRRASWALQLQISHTPNLG